MGLGVKLVAFPFPHLYITVWLGLFVVTFYNATTLSFSFSFSLLSILLMYMPDTHWQSEPELLEDLMPWSPDVKEECKQ